MTRLRVAIDARMKDGGNERGAALVSTLLFMSMLAGLSLVLLSVLLGQITPSYSAQKSTRTVYAAQAGLQAGLGLVRSAAAAPDATGLVFGDPSELPCSFSGRLDGEDDEVGYSVEIHYFLEDPTGSDEVWQSANDLPCTASSGVAEQPNYALIDSEGRAAAVPRLHESVGNRHLTATYQFRVSNANIPGGRIFDADKSDCLEAENAQIGSLIRFVPASECVAVNESRQLWVYDIDYQIKLTSSTVDGVTPLCITDPPPHTGNARDAKLEACRTDSARWNQLWSWEGKLSWKGQKNPISAGTSTRCLSPNGNGANRKLTVVTGCNGTFAPEPAVGSGAAGYKTHQIVNYKEFGRCTDVTNEIISYQYMTVYPCKQDPTETKGVFWNHKWFYSEPTVGQSQRANQQIYVYFENKSSEKYCLQAPVIGGLDVLFKGCNGSALQDWTRFYDTGDYATSYVFVDTHGRCLAADASQPLADRDSHLRVTSSRIIMQSCNGSEEQKWNAPANYSDAEFGSFKESSG